jgi:glyoxylase-like metal-dependent hydrolase (beta-lactamase superfamily II)
MTTAATPGSPDPTAESATVTAEGATFASKPRRLRYAKVETPAAGKSVPITPGVRWARIALPMELNHINVWLIDTDDGCIVVDTGMVAPVGKESWDILEREVLAETPLRAVFVTHIHPDHIGLAAWLQERHRVPVWMSRRTYEQASAMSNVSESLWTEAQAFFHSHGLTDPSPLHSMFKPERASRMAGGLPQVDRYVADGDLLRWGASEWRAMQTDGHAEGHLCLSNDSAHVLISGDQVLPVISSNISFMFGNADPNPLGSYIASLERLRELPADTLVLPSHGVPFYGLQHRADDLIRHHREQLEMLVRECQEPKTAAELLSTMFWRELTGIHLFLALGEALAHLEFLAHAGRAERRIDAGLTRYQTRGLTA